MDKARSWWPFPLWCMSIIWYSLQIRIIWYSLQIRNFFKMYLIFFRLYCEQTTALCYVNVAGAMWRITGHDIHLSKVIEQKVLGKPYVKHWQNIKLTTSFVCNLLGPKVTVLATGVNCWVTLSRRCSYRLSHQFSSTDILKKRAFVDNSRFDTNNHNDWYGRKQHSHRFTPVRMLQISTGK